MAGRPLLSPTTGFNALRRQGARVSVFAAGLFLLAASAFGGVAWIAAAGDPLGGEPIARFDVEMGDLVEREMLTAPAQTAAAETETLQTPSGPATMRAEPATYNAGAAPSPPARQLLEEHGAASLPRIGADGTRPSEVYARPYDTRNRGPFVGLIVGGLGLSETTTRKAIEELPGEITLAFVPYADNLGDWAARARAMGHETMIELPMEPFDYPANDPGPYTLLTSLPEQDNLKRLDWLLSRFDGYFAATNYLGAKFTTSHTSLKPVLRTLEERGVAYIDDGSSKRSVLDIVARNTDSVWTSADRIVDRRVDPQLIDDQLLELEALALQNGASLGRGSAYPATLDSLIRWSASLERRGYRLAPASAILRMRVAAQQNELAAR